MKLLTSVLIAFLLLSCSSLGAVDRFATIKESPFKPVKFEKHEGGTTTFSGSAEISGRFIIVWWNDEEDLIRIKMIPDEKSQAVLPYLVSGLSASALGPVREVEFDGSKSNVRKLLPPEKAKALLSKRIREATGIATVRIKNYMSGVDCDNRWYQASIVSVRLQQVQPLMAGNNVAFRC